MVDTFNMYTDSSHVTSTNPNAIYGPIMKFIDKYFYRRKIRSTSDVSAVRIKLLES